jgi:FkbM family methyltransferase
MSVLANLIKAYWQSGLRGSWRVSDFLSKHFSSLHSVPIEVEGGTLFADLRIGSARAILASPRSKSGEDAVMRRYVRPGRVVLDVGAHFGFYTLLLSKLVGEGGKVFAFEPNPELLPSLRRTLEPINNVELFEVALSDQPGEIELFVPEDASMASLSDWTKGRAGSVHSVRCERKVLDAMYEAGTIRLPDFIKCDVEGAELMVFAGGRQVLDRVDAPVVLFELNQSAATSFGRTTGEYFEFFEGLEHPHYSFFEVFPDGIRDLSSRSTEYSNIVAIPASRQ